MLKFAIVAKNPKNAGPIKDTAVRLGFVQSSKPEFIISIGGDGTLLRAEHKYPGIPKLMIRDSNVCQKCQDLGYDDIFMCLADEEFKIKEYRKLEARVNGKKYYAMNDVSVRNKLPIHAIRFTVTIGDDVYPLIGDGAVVATPYGSTGYFYSITKKHFRKGMGLAFNNVTTKTKNRVFRRGAVVIIKLFRHDAEITIDNDLKILTLKEGQTVTIKKSDLTAKIVRVKPRKWHLPFRRHRRRSRA